MSPRTETRIASIYIDDQQIMVIEMKEIGLVDEYDVLDLNLAIRHLADGKTYAKLVIAAASIEMSKEAKAMAKKEFKLSQCLARAIVVSNLFKSSARNFVEQFNDNQFPQQFFHDREEAVKWLLEVRSK